jgi:hypothetical protein
VVSGTRTDRSEEELFAILAAGLVLFAGYCYHLDVAYYLSVETRDSLSCPFFGI